jgi:hypothetical protein
LFDEPVSGFVYPFGRFDDPVAPAVHNAGHIDDRTPCATESGVETHDAMVAAPSCHFLATDFWPHFDRARPTCVFWFWGSLRRARQRGDVDNLRGVARALVRRA